MQEAGDLLQLGDVVLPVAAVLLQQGEHAVVLAAGVGRVQRLQLLEDGSPGGLLLRRVLHLGDHLATRGAGFWLIDTAGKHLVAVFRAASSR